MVVGGLAVEVEDDLLRAAAQGGIIAHRMGPQPLGGWRAAGENLVANRPVYRRVLIRQQAEQGVPLALGKVVGSRAGTTRIHTLRLHAITAESGREVNE
jgi:hypothetical protein